MKNEYNMLAQMFQEGNNCIAYYVRFISNDIKTAEDVYSIINRDLTNNVAPDKVMGRYKSIVRLSSEDNRIIYHKIDKKYDKYCGTLICLCEKPNSLLWCLSNIQNEIPWHLTDSDRFDFISICGINGNGTQHTFSVAKYGNTIDLMRQYFPVEETPVFIIGKDKNKIFYIHNQGAIKMYYKLLPNINEYENMGSVDDIFISFGDFKYGTIVQRVLKRANSGFRYLTLTNFKYKIKICDGRLLISDGNLGIKLISENIAGFVPDLGSISISQFRFAPINLIIRDNANRKFSNMSLILVSPENLNSEYPVGPIIEMIGNTDGNRRVQSTDGRLPTTKFCKRRGRVKRVWIPISLYSSSHNSSMRCGVLPLLYKDDTLMNLDVIKSIVQELITNTYQVSIETLRRYVKSFSTNTVHQEDDVLSKWFSTCTRTAINTNTSILNAYKTMLENLEKEYKDIGEYLSQYNFSNCQPIPKLVMDKRLQKECNKSLTFFAHEKQVNNIGKHKVVPYKIVSPMIKFSIREHGNMIQLATLNVKDYYNNKDNEVDLRYNKMKGAVKYAKTKNRR